MVSPPFPIVYYYSSELYHFSSISDHPFLSQIPPISPSNPLLHPCIFHRHLHPLLASMTPPIFKTRDPHATVHISSTSASYSPVEFPVIQPAMSSVSPAKTSGSPTISSSISPAKSPVVRATSYSISPSPFPLDWQESSAGSSHPSYPVIPIRSFSLSQALPQLLP